MNPSRSFTSRARNFASKMWGRVVDAWDWVQDFATYHAWFALLIVCLPLAAIFALVIGINNIVIGDLPMCNPNVATTQTKVEVRNVTKPFVSAKLSLPGKMEWREAGTYTNPDEGWQSWEGNTSDVENDILAVRTVTETDGQVCTAGTIYLGARNGETVHLTKVEFHKA